MITLVGKDGMKQQTRLLFNKGKEAMDLGNGWKDFVKANGLKTGDSFKLKLTWEDTAPVLTLCRAECRYSTSPSQNRFVTLTLKHANLRRSRLNLPSSFVRENGITKPGMITLLGNKDSKKWLASLLRDCRGIMSLGNGWKIFAEANGLKIGESFTFESIGGNATPVLSLLSAKSTNEKMQEGESSKAGEKVDFLRTKQWKQDQESHEQRGKKRFIFTKSKPICDTNIYT